MERGQLGKEADRAYFFGSASAIRRLCANLRSRLRTGHPSLECSRSNAVPTHPSTQVLYVVGHIGAEEQGDLFDDVLYVKVGALGRR